MILTSALAVLLLSPGSASSSVDLRRVPNGGIQPQIVKDSVGTTHLLYYSGDARNGDLFYVKSKDDGTSWSKPIRVNHEPGNAIAMGTIRGGQLAVADGRVHVVWNGSKGKPATGMHAEMARRHGAEANEMPLLYTRSNPDGSFETERNLHGRTKSLDGGASIAADRKGVYVVWHASVGTATSEGDRKVWIARSTNSGATFERERPIWNEHTGACACCGMKAIATDGTVWVSYRSAKEEVNRDSYLIKSSDGGKSFQGRVVSKWKVNTCPMSSYWLQRTPQGVEVGVEESGAVLYMKSGKAGVSTPVRPDVFREAAKYPTAATSGTGVTLYVWTEGMGWNKGGTVAWRAFDKNGKLVTGGDGRQPGVPAWSMVAVLPRKDGSFAIYY